MHAQNILVFAKRPCHSEQVQKSVQHNRKFIFAKQQKLQLVQQQKVLHCARNKSFEARLMHAIDDAKYVEGRTDGPTDGPTDGRTHGRMNRVQLESNQRLP